MAEERWMENIAPGDGRQLVDWWNAHDKAHQYDYRRYPDTRRSHPLGYIVRWKTTEDQ